MPGIRLTVRRAALWLVPAALAIGAGPAWAGGRSPCNPTAYGAVGDGTTDNTAALQAAIDACAAQGGGVVRLSGGTYLTGPIVLKDHILLQIDKGATLLGSADHTKYSNAYIGSPYHANEALVSAVNATDVGIIGDGTIDGQGGAPDQAATDSKHLSWWDAAIAAKKAKPPSFYISQTVEAPSSNGLPRPWLVEFYRSSHILVKGVHLQNSPMWTLVLRYSNDAVISNMSVSAPGATAPNTDATDVVASNKVVIDHVSSSTGDDNVSLKSGLPDTPAAGQPLPYADPGLPKMATTNVIISNSNFKDGHGVSMGSETINGIQHVRLSNLTFDGTANGFRIKTGRDRGNLISDIVADNLTMTNVQFPIWISEYYPNTYPPTNDSAQPITPTTPYVRDITVRNLTATGAQQAGLALGLPESRIENLKLQNVSIASTGKGFELEHVTGAFSHVTITTPNSTTYPPFVDLGDVQVTVNGQPLS